MKKKRVHKASKLKDFSEARIQAQQALEQQKGQSKMAAEREKTTTTRERRREGRLKFKKQR